VRKIKIVMPLAGTASVAVLILASALGTANAATTACSGAASGECGSQVNTYGNAFNVKGNRAIVGSLIIAYPDSTTNTGGDFNAVQTTANPNERTFEFAPGNKLSGDCISQPSGSTGLVLRPCRAPGDVNAKFQEFTGVNPSNTAGTQWTNVASKQTVQPNGTRKQLTAVTKVTNVNGSYWGFSMPGVPPAQGR
jgi:hypothetical protein